MGTPRGTEAGAPPERVESVLAGVRRLTALADGARDSETVFRALAGELLSVPGADEVHIHHLARDGVAEELTVVYMFDGHARVSYLLPRAERPPGVSWVANAWSSGVRTPSASSPPVAVSSWAASEPVTFPGRVTLRPSEVGSRAVPRISH